MSQSNLINGALEQQHLMAKRKVGRPKQSNNNMGVQSGANLTGSTMSSQSPQLKTSSVTYHDTTTTPPPVGGGSKTGAQESPSTSDVELEYDVIPPDKGKGKAVPDNTEQGGSGHDPPREWERTLVAANGHQHRSFLQIMQKVSDQQN